jgi:hypothetical protein
MINGIVADELQYQVLHTGIGVILYMWSFLERRTMRYKGILVVIGVSVLMDAVLRMGGSLNAAAYTAIGHILAPVRLATRVMSPRRTRDKWKLYRARFDANPGNIDEALASILTTGTTRPHFFKGADLEQLQVGGDDELQMLVVDKLNRRAITPEMLASADRPALLRIIGALVTKNDELMGC